MATTVIVVMGVSGCGKTTIAGLLAARLGWRLAEADEFHSPSNIAKMKSGIALTDEDRGPWLDAIARWIDGIRAAGGHGVVTCSALRRRYRERLSGGRDDVRFAYLRGGFALVAGRLAARKHAYMPASLLQTQFDTLEEPGPDENPIVVAIDRAPDAIVDQVVAALGVDAPPRG
jgi:carbohydrate kinase (thermoresistant glucokinase family)